MKKIITKSTPRSKIYGALSAKLNSAVVVEKWLNAAELTIAELAKEAPIHVDFISATFEMPNRLLLRMGIGINKNPDILVRNEGIIRRKINDCVGKPIIDAIIHTSLLFAQLEIVDVLNVGVIYHDVRLTTAQFLSLIKTINEM